jgi:predicted Zn-dependent peptidase
MPATASDRKITVTVLDNGLRVITEPMASVRSVAFGFWLETGSRYESLAQNGISHFIEHMLFKGTPTRNAERIAKDMDGLGGHLDAFTGRELVGYTAKVLDVHVGEAFEILGDMLVNPKFDEEELEREKGVILEELKMESDSPESLVHDLFVSAFWDGNPLGRPILGTRKTIRSFHPDVLREHHRKFYAPANITLTAAGNLRHDDIVRLAELHFGHLPAGKHAPDFEAPRVSPPLTLKNRRSLQQVQMYLGAPSYCADHPLRYASYTLNVILGGGMSSRLFQKIREQQGLAYSIFSELNLYRDTGLFAISAGTSRETARQVLECTLAEVRQVKRELVPAEELRRAKEYMKGSLLLSLESSGSRMSNLARQWLTFGRFFSLDEVAEAIESVTAEQVLQAAQDSFQPGSLGLVLLGRLDGLEVRPEDLEC